jgi:quercetin dioxygenase-like cupin family protein
MNQEIATRLKAESEVNPIKSFSVFGEPVQILTDSTVTAGRSMLMTQCSPPGGGPPPHSHENEDETFFVLEGEYEVLVEGVAHRLSAGDAIHAIRGSVHTFRNVGTVEGKMLVSVVPGGFENYLEEISHLSVPDEISAVLAVSERYGITFDL